MMMKIRSLQDLKTSISRTVNLSFFILFGFSAIVFFITHSKLESNKLELGKAEIRSAINIYQADLSEKLSIIASANIFTDYLRSGFDTRNKLYPSFLSEILSLNVKSVSGMEITDREGNILFKNGKLTPDWINLNLCYLNENLDNSIGTCQYFWKVFLSKERIIKRLSEINNKISPCTHCKPIALIERSDFGNFKINDAKSIGLSIKSNDESDGLIHIYALLSLLTLFVSTFVNKVRVQNLVTRFIAKPIENLTQKIRQNFSVTINVNEIQEIQYLQTQIKNWKEKLNVVQEKEHEAKIGRLAAQVAHDIRSPLAALDIIVRDLSSLPEKHRLTIRRATQRINDIANNLLNTYKTKDSSSLIEDNQKPTSIEFLPPLLESIISEKRTQYLHHDVTLNLEIADNAYLAFSCLNDSEFKRLLSNLVNNAIEAIKEKGIITLSLNKNQNQLELHLIDNGCGIPDSLLPDIFKAGFSSKNKGFGLGLANAHAVLATWGGHIAIHSKVDVGTDIHIILPAASPPEWFLEKLEIKAKSTLVVLDDDISIHEVWHSRLNELICEYQIQMVDFYNTNDLLAWHKKYHDNCVTYLIDYEIIGSDKTGLDLILQENLSAQSVLVTSRFEDTQIREMVIAHHIKMIPKSYSVTIPLEIKSEEEGNVIRVKEMYSPQSIYKPNVANSLENIQPELILLDDDQCLTDAWTLACEIRGKSIIAFNDVATFFEHIDKYDKEIPVYLDYELEEEVKGTDVAKIVYEKGYTHLFLMTGHPKEMFSNLPYFKDIVGKKIPF